MYELYSGETMRRADERASIALGIPSLILMENAGRGAAEIILRRYGGARSCAILCGPGSNGGDGFVAARHLSNSGLEVKVIYACDPDRYEGDAAAAHKACMMCERVSFIDPKYIGSFGIRNAIVDSDVVIDAMLGTGQSGAPRGEIETLIGMLDEADARNVVSLDVPSGVDPDTGEVPGAAVRASLSISFLAHKVGTHVAPGKFYAGEVVTCDIGVHPRAAISIEPPSASAFSAEDIASMKPRLAPDAHKGSRGGLLVIGGCDSFRGAPLLVARAALRAGCGYVFLAVPDFIAQHAAAYIPEAIMIPLKTDKGFIHGAQRDDVLAKWDDKIDAAVIGPGMGRSEHTEMHLRRALHILASTRRPLLIDGDALHYLADVELKARDPMLLVTPHAGEAARLLGTASDDVSARRLASCREIAHRYGAALLKGPHTIVAGDGAPRVITEGSQALAVPGSGDVLSGAIGALLAMGMSTADAATLGALMHAQAVSRSRRDGVLLATEIADALDGVR